MELCRFKLFGNILTRRTPQSRTTLPKLGTSRWRSHIRRVKFPGNLQGSLRARVLSASRFTTSRKEAATLFTRAWPKRIPQIVSHTQFKENLSLEIKQLTNNHI